MIRPIGTRQGELFVAGELGGIVPRKRSARALGIDPCFVTRFEKSDRNFPVSIYRNGKAHATDAALKRYRYDLIARGLA